MRVFFPDILLSPQFEKAFPNKIPKGLGSLTATLLGSKILDWQRFKN